MNNNTVILLSDEYAEVCATVDDSIIDYADSLFNYSECEYISDVFFRNACDAEDIYYDNLIAWVQAKDNAWLLEDVIEEGLYNIERGYNLYDHIRRAQNLACEREQFDNASDIIKIAAIKYLVNQTDTIGADLLDTIYSELDSIDTSARICDIFEAVNNCLDTIDNE